MISTSVATLAQWVSGRVVGVDPQLRVTGSVVSDSRQVDPGSLFVALVGESVDGHDYAAAAAAAGATVVLAERELRDPQGELVPCIVVPDSTKALGDVAREVLAQLQMNGPLQVVGITGSVGKTTTKDLISAVLGAAGPTVAPIRSFNNEIGLPLTVLTADENTRYLVLEMGASAPGDLLYLTNIAPVDVAVVLAVGHAHLGGFGGTLDDVAAAKRELLTGAAPGAVAVLNFDDPRVAAMATPKDANVEPGEPVTADPSADVVSFGRSDGVQIRATNVEPTSSGRYTFTLTSSVPGREGQTTIATQLIGEHHVHNALAAAGTATVLGLDLELIASVLNRSGAVSPHRMALVERQDGVTILDDSYNANPDSMRAALKALAAISRPDRRAVAVLGEMRELGAASRQAHDAIGRLVVRLGVDLAVVIGEGARPIADGAAHEGSWGDEVAIVDDIDAAETFLRSQLRSGDVVLVKSSYGAGLWQLADRLGEAHK